MPEHGLLSPAQTSLLTDQYELAMAASYHRRGLNEDAVFELFVRRLPDRRDWLLAAGLGPALELLRAARFGPEEIAYRLRYIGAEQLAAVGHSMKGSAYGQYLLRLLSEEA